MIFYLDLIRFILIVIIITATGKERPRSVLLPLLILSRKYDVDAVDAADRSDDDHDDDKDSIISGGSGYI